MVPYFLLTLYMGFSAGQHHRSFAPVWNDFWWLWWPMISGDGWGLSFPDICVTVEEKPQKKQRGKLARPGVEPGTARWEATMLPLDHSGGTQCEMSTPVVQWLSYSPLDPRFAGSIPAGVVGFFSESKNPEYDFLRKGSKSVGPVS